MSSQLLNLEEYGTKAEELVKSIGIPTQPKVILEVQKAINNPSSDIGTISSIISKDVAISAKVLKVVNSPFFGLREKVDSIDRALALMGIKNFNKIILASSLRETLGGKNQAIEKFWNHSVATASIASHIASKIGFESPEQAYTAGLFHDCGIPLLMKKFSDYGDIVDYALSVANTDSLLGKSKSVVGIEDERYATHHCAVGYMVAKSWNLSPAVHESIWYHHYIHLNIHINPATKRLSAILLLADYIGSYMLFLRGGCPVDTEAEWAKLHSDVIFELDLQTDDIKDLKDDSTEKYMSATQE